jgi:nanoRNase/pAp phosphatase (c-di-AMP/oligoRNAs hydrolase)
MSNKLKMFVWLDADLDAAGSFLTLTWLFKIQKIPFMVCTANRFRESFLEWQKNANINDYEKIFILDLDVSPSSDLIDRKNVVIIDHHDTHKNEYKEATAIIDPTAPSTCKLLYQKLYKKISQESLAPEQKYLILLANDYDSYQFKLKETRCLNTIFWNFQGNKVEKFCERFKNGFDKFTIEEDNICHFYQKRLERIKSELKIYTATIPISEKEYKFVSTFAEEFINDVAEYVLEKTKSEICLVVNLKTSKVSFRRTQDSTFDVAKLAQKLGKEGESGGHQFSAGAGICDSLLEFSRLFKPVVQ